MEQQFGQIKANQIIEIDLSDKQLSDTQITLLAEALKDTQSLLSLKLCSCQIGLMGLSALTNALKVNSSLITLDLAGNGMGDAGTQMICEVLKINQTLTKLRLDSNQIGLVGANALNKMLKINHTLTALELNDNQIGDEAIWAMVEALEKNRTLTSLNLANNEIGDFGGMALSKVLKMNRTLTALSFTSINYVYNGIDDDTRQIISKALYENKARNQIKNTRNQTLLTLLILLRHVQSPESTLPLEVWKLILYPLNFPSEKKDYRTSKDLVEFLTKKNIFAEFNERLKTQRNFRLVEKCHPSLGESQFSFLVPLKRKFTSEIDYQLNERFLLQK